MKISLSRIGTLILILAVATLAVIYITPLLWPFIIGWGITLVINPTVNRLTHSFGLRRTLSVTITLLLFVSLIIWIITVLLINLSLELFHFSQALPQYMQHFSQFIYEVLPQKQLYALYERYQDWYGSLHSDTQTQIDLKIQDWLHTSSNYGVSIIQGVLNALIRFITTLPNTLTVLIISIVAAFLFSKDYEQIRDWIKRIMPTRSKKNTTILLADLKMAMLGFLKAQLIMISISMILITLGLYILDIENSIVIGLIGGLLDLIPYLGTGTLFIPWLLYLYFTHQYSLVIGISILYGIIVLVRQILEPRIVAKHVGINPIIALVALFVGMQLFGFKGMILGPFVVIFFQSLYRARVFHQVWEYIRIDPVK